MKTVVALGRTPLGDSAGACILYPCRKIREPAVEGKLAGVESSRRSRPTENLTTALHLGAMLGARDTTGFHLIASRVFAETFAEFLRRLPDLGLIDHSGGRVTTDLAADHDSAYSMYFNDLSGTDWNSRRTPTTRPKRSGNGYPNRNRPVSKTTAIMPFTRTGVILYVRNYPECVAFYRDLLSLRILFRTPELTCFAFGDSYLMVEMDDEDSGVENARGRPLTCLRMNVPDIRERTDELIRRGVDVDYQENAWGTVAKFHDPDGNLCSFKDDEKFEEQVRRSS